MRLVVVGCGSFGSHLACTMSRQGHSVSVVDHDSAAKERLSPDFAGKFIVGVGVDIDALIEAGIEKADGLAAVTGDDDTNLAAAMVARKRFRVPQVVASVLEPAKVAAYGSAGIHIVCPPAWGYRTVRSILTLPSAETVLTLANGEVKIAAITIGAVARGMALRDVVAAPGIATVALVRDGKASVPTGTTTLSPGDLLYVSVSESAAAVFAKIASSLED